MKGQTESQTERQQFMQTTEHIHSNQTVTFFILQLGRKSKLFSITLGCKAQFLTQKQLPGKTTLYPPQFQEVFAPK